MFNQWYYAYLYNMLADFVIHIMDTNSLSRDYEYYYIIYRIILDRQFITNNVPSIDRVRRVLNTVDTGYWSNNNIKNIRYQVIA